MNILKLIKSLFPQRRKQKETTYKINSVQSKRIINGKDPNISKVTKYISYEEGWCGTTDMDTHADMCVVGRNFRPISFTGEQCTVSPYTESYKPIQDIKVCFACTAVDYDETGETLTVDVNQAFYFGDTMNNSLLNPNQLR